MDHPESRIVDLYAAGRLPEAEVERFEEHLIECAVCREQVESAEGVRTALRDLAADEAARAVAATAPPRPMPIRPPSSRRPLRALLLAAALLLVAVLPLGLLWQLRGLRQEVAAAQKREAEALTRSAQVPSPGSAAEVARLSADLARERGASQALSTRIAALERPQSNPLFASLGVQRGGDPSVVPPGQRIQLGRTPSLVVLSIEPPAAAIPAYRPSLRTRDGQLVWQGDRLAPGGDGNLALAFASTFLVPGVYRLHLEALGGPSGEPAAFDIPFEILAAR